ncbi:hypothetical protein [Isoalcanivorax indicus]|uniref:hypothetical protein n=1 Tax=Isoalcanivorax indicus TaxID=2202653 RepID=UPI000DBA1595|nr:hypothetical protein [Isoalcanivorax indicus]
MGTVKTMSELVREKLDQAADSGADQFISAIRPIYGASDHGRPEHISSGLLLLWKDKQYLVTAAHVIDENSESTLYLGVGSCLQEISAGFFCTKKPDNDRSKDYYDFAWTELTNLSLEGYNDLSFISESEISLEGSCPDENAYLALGYPNSKNKKHDNVKKRVAPKYMKYTSTLKRDKSWATERYLSGNDHILLKYHSKHARDSDGNKVNTLSPRGASGGALIDMGALHQVEAYKPNHTPVGRLVGMIIEKSAKHDVLVAVKIGSILEQIERCSH